MKASITPRNLKRHAMSLAARVGVDDPLRSVRLAVAPHYVRRDKRDNELIKSLLAALLEADSCCLDVGAHGGEVLRQIVQCAPQGHHIAYEPLPELHSGLVDEFPFVDVRCAALGREDGHVSFVRVIDALGYSGFRRQEYPREMRTEWTQVRVEVLDDAIPESWVPRVIKIDVEGAELDVLTGGIETIIRHRPVVIFEHFKGSARHYATTPSMVYELLVGYVGQRIFDIDGDGPYSLNQFEQAFEEGIIWTFVAH